MAAGTGRDQAAVRLSLAEYFGWRRRFDDWIATTTISLGCNGARAAFGWKMAGRGVCRIPAISAKTSQELKCQVVRRSCCTLLLHPRSLV
jgi:hypothetical protein